VNVILLGMLRRIRDLRRPTTLTMVLVTGVLLAAVLVYYAVAPPQAPGCGDDILCHMR
jgi:hypothetical protein